jgi:murein L,D-transpeptidase YafK
MKFLFAFIILLKFLPVYLPHKDRMQENFKSIQLKNSRVQQAYREKEDGIKDILLKNHIEMKSLEIFIRIFKRTRQVELWGKNKNDAGFIFLKSFPFCSSSGTLGPKRKQGDNQIPEGFYHINRFNPNSNFCLSLGINYPNASDRIFGDRQFPGGDIFIHGNCVTIGCIPITDDLIKELYVFSVEARNNGQKNIPVHIFPGRLDKESFGDLVTDYRSDKSLVTFWSNLKDGFDYFELNKIPPEINISSGGMYNFE